MRIALDARTIYWRTRHGTGKNLIDLYRTVATLQPGWRVTAYHRFHGPTAGLLPAMQVEPRFFDMPGDRFHAWEKFRLPLQAWRDGADVLHCPANTCTPWMSVPTVVTIHDLIPLDLPHGRDPAQVRHFRQSIVNACRNAACIICPSQYTRDRLVQQFGADANRITVNPWAPDGSMFYVEPDRRRTVLDRYGVNRQFVLHFGAASLRKNTRRVVEAWAGLADADRRDWQLLVVGLDDKTRADLQLLADHRGLGDSLRLHGFADEADLPALMSGAEVLAFPSLAEGFGLPILDAWSTWTAVLTSNRASLPEVAGNAAVLVEPADVNAITTGLACLMRDLDLRRRLVALGAARLKNFSWRRTAERFIQTMELAAGLTTAKAAA